MDYGICSKEERRNLEESRQRLTQQAEEQRRHQEWLAGEQARMNESERQRQYYASEEKRRIEASLKAQYDQQLLEEHQRMQAQLLFNKNRTGAAPGTDAGATAQETTVLVAGGGKRSPINLRPMSKVVDQTEKKGPSSAELERTSTACSGIGVATRAKPKRRQSPTPSSQCPSTATTDTSWPAQPSRSDANSCLPNSAAEFNNSRAKDYGRRRERD